MANKPITRLTRRASELLRESRIAADQARDALAVRDAYLVGAVNAGAAQAEVARWASMTAAEVSRIVRAARESGGNAA